MSDPTLPSVGHSVEVYWNEDQPSTDGASTETVSGVEAQAVFDDAVRRLLEELLLESQRTNELLTLLVEGR